MSAAARRRGRARSGVRGSSRATLLWLLLLTVAVLGIAWQLRHAPAPTAHDDDDKPAELLVPAPLADWRSLELLVQGQRLRFERDGSGAWYRHAEVAGEAPRHAHTADPTAARQLADSLATLSRARIERTLAGGEGRLPNYGLANPPLVVLVQGEGGRVLQTLALGDVAPDGLSRYAHLPQTHRVVTLADFQARGLMSLAGPAVATTAASQP